MKTYVLLLLVFATASFLLVLIVVGRPSRAGSPAPAVAASAPRAINDAQLARDFETLRNASIFFQHMSVGRNILDGVERLNAGKPTLRFQHLDLEKDLQNGKFAIRERHFVTANGGSNRFPKTKIDAFREIVTITSPAPELALMKLCYIDFTGETDVAELFASYQRAVQALRSAHPDLTIVHVTTPLVVKDPNWKDAIKGATGYKDDAAQANLKRHEYNELLRKAFAKEPIFDLARYESLHPDGTRETFDRNGKVYPSLAPEYASDGQHLNESGANQIARHFVHFLAETARTRSAQ